MAEGGGACKGGGTEECVERASNARSTSIDGNSTAEWKVEGLLGGNGDGLRGPITRRSLDSDLDALDARDGERISLVGDSGRGVVERFVLLDALEDGRKGNGGSSANNQTK